MRIQIKGEARAVQDLKYRLHESLFVISGFFPAYTVILEERENSNVVLLDSVDSQLERDILAWVSRLLAQNKTGVRIEIQREGGIQDERTCRVFMPADDKVQAITVIGIASALQHTRQAQRPSPKRAGWIARILAGLVLSSLAIAQQIPGGTLNIGKIGNVTQSGANVVDPVNSAFRVNCILGCGGGGGISAQNQVRNSTDTLWVNVGFNAGANLRMPVDLFSYNGTAVGPANPFDVKAGTGVTWDVSDRAGRLLGIVYGSQGQQLKQTAVNFNLGTELFTGATAYDARQIRALTVADAVTASQGGAPWSFQLRNPGNTLFLGDAANPVRTDPTGTTTQPVNGTVTSNQGGAPWTARIQDGVGAPLATVTAGNALKVDNSAVTQPVSGTVTANQGTPNTNANGWFARITDATNNAAVKAASTAAAATDPALVVAVSPNNTIPANVTQFGGTNVSTGTGASGAGIPRVTVANDSQVRVLGNAGAIVDAANNAAAPANVVVHGVEVISQGTQPTAATSGNVRRSLASVEGVMYVQEGNSNRFSCLVQAVTVTTQCQAAPGAGLRAYVTGIYLSNQAATVQTLDIVFGTGANCVTGITALTHKFQFGTLATTTSPHVLTATFLTPLVPTAANAICVRPSAATAFGATITGYIAP